MKTAHCSIYIYIYIYIFQIRLFKAIRLKTKTVALSEIKTVKISNKYNFR